MDILDLMAEKKGGAAVCSIVYHDPYNTFELSSSGFLKVDNPTAIAVVSCVSISRIVKVQARRQPSIVASNHANVHEISFCCVGTPAAMQLWQWCALRWPMRTAPMPHWRLSALLQPPAFCPLLCGHPARTVSQQTLAWKAPLRLQMHTGRESRCQRVPTLGRLGRSPRGLCPASSMCMLLMKYTHFQITDNSYLWDLCMTEL